MQHRLGLIHAIRLPFWKKEGYAQYIGLGALPLESAVTALGSPDRDPRIPGEGAVPGLYLEAAVVWAFLLQIEGESFDEVMRRSDSFPELLEGALRSAP